MLISLIISLPYVGFIWLFPAMMVESGGVDNILLYFVVSSLIFSSILFFIFKNSKESICKKTYVTLSLSFVMIFMYTGDMAYDTMGIHSHIEDKKFIKEVKEIELYLEKCDLIYSLDLQHFNNVDRINYYISKEENIIIEKHIGYQEYPTFRYNYVVEKSWIDEITQKFLLETENMNNGNSIYEKGYMEYGTCDIGSMNVTKYYHSSTNGLFEYIYYDGEYYLSTFTAGSINSEEHFLNDYIADRKVLGGDLYNYRLSSDTHRLRIDSIKIGEIQQVE